MRNISLALLNHISDDMDIIIPTLKMLYPEFKHDLEKRISTASDRFSVAIVSNPIYMFRLVVRGSKPNNVITIHLKLPQYNTFTLNSNRKTYMMDLMSLVEKMDVNSNGGFILNENNG